MKGQDVYIISTATMAFCTFIGVGSALAYYLTEIRKVTGMELLLSEALYLAVTLLFIWIVREKLK